MAASSRVEMGDWQTPPDFALQCARIVKDKLGAEPDVIVEPTAGDGAFVAAARRTFPNVRIVANELALPHLEELTRRFSGDPKVDVLAGDILNRDDDVYATVGTDALVLGNPPWVTSSALGVIRSTNHPEKLNVKHLSGYDAMTGASNFDIAEWIILDAVERLGHKLTLLAMLVKTSVARSVILELNRRRFDFGAIVLGFDAHKVFNVGTAACLLILDMRRPGPIRRGDMSMPDRLEELNIVDGKLRPVIPAGLQDMLGDCELTWRQGVKHDAASIMELRREDGHWVNRQSETVDVEDEYLYPYVKSSGSRQPLTPTSTMRVPMTQTVIGEDTAHLRDDAPRLWAYLNEHRAVFDGRRSRIYQNAPAFAMFGVGSYSYAPWKVAVSGFYKKPVFTLAGGEKPVMLDDTCYFLPFQERGPALACMLLLNSDPVQDLLSRIAFLDSKRPFTKKLLAQLDLDAALRQVGYDGLAETARLLDVDAPSREDMEGLATLLAPIRLDV